MTSAPVTLPRSPGLASVGCTKLAGVPVEASVAAILRPTWPLLPMPVTMMRPLAPAINCTAAAKFTAIAVRNAAASASSPSVSTVTVRNAEVSGVTAVAPLLLSGAPCLVRMLPAIAKIPSCDRL